MSTQWSDTPYFYPIQIAQFALQHYSRMFEDTNVPHREVLLKSYNSNITNIDSNILKIVNNSLRIILVPESYLNIISFLWNPLSLNSSFYIELKIKKRNFLLNFIFSDDKRCVWIESSTNTRNQIVFAYSLGRGYLDEFMNLKINLKTSLISALKSKPDISFNLTDFDSIIPISLTFRENSIISFDSMKQMNSDYNATFLKAADWFLANQDSNGGWPTFVEKKISNKLFLKSPWYSAMAQGHALSVLTRAYNFTSDERYLNAGRRSLHLFAKMANDSGIINNLFGHVWYEEYPTTPGNFVLNGFMYSLIGLYDFSAIDNSSLTFFDIGIESLKNFISFFDTGTRSLYDLRHVTLRIEPRIAGWKYHNLHIYLLKWLYVITNEKIFDEISNRWALYSNGYRAAHN